MQRRDRPISKRSRHFERGLATAGDIARRCGSRRTEIELQLARGLSLFTAEGFISAEAAKAYARARELAEKRGDPHQQFMAVYGLWQSANGSGVIIDCRQILGPAAAIDWGRGGRRITSPGAPQRLGNLLVFRRPAAAREHCEAGRRLYDPERHRSHRQLYGGHDPGACARYLGAQADWLLGYPDKALGDW